MNTCDIIIPAYNNAATLPLVLEAINEQAIPTGWAVHILVCDDGSTEHYELRSANYELQYLPGTHRGAAAARNWGIKISTADVILFLGADIILRPQALQAHLQFHTDNPRMEDAALGFVMWDPRVRPTPLMEWMAHGGPQNNFDSLLGDFAEVPLYGSNVSIKRILLGDMLFREEYTTYGWEDIDLGRRLAARGMRLVPLVDAIGLHRHFYSASDIFRRQFFVGANSHTYYRHFQGEVPLERLLLRHRIQHVLYGLGPGALVRAVTRWAATRFTLPRLFAHAVNYEYRRGIFAGFTH